MVRKPTLHDVASVAGVSTRTVSRVVNDERGMSEATRRRVRAVIEELGYRPNLAARSLVTRRTNAFGLVVSDLTDPFFPELADSVIRAARIRGRTVFVGTTNDDGDVQTGVLDSLVSHGVDALIVFPTYDSYAALCDIADGGLPVVAIDAPIRHRRVGVVMSDIRAGAGLAVEHLISTGHTRIGMLNNSRSQRRWRETRFRETMGNAGLPVPEDRVAAGPPSIEGGRTAARSLIEGSPDTTALFAYNDLMAIGALAQLRAMGRRVPDDVAVVGFDDIALSEFTTPAITTVRLDRELLGSESVDMAAALADGGPDPDPVILPVTLVRRDSA